MELHPERVSNIMSFINKDNWKTFEKNYPIIAPNFLYIKEEEICPAYI